MAVIVIDLLARAANGTAAAGALDAGLIYRGEFLDGYSLDNQDFAMRSETGRSIGAQ